MIVISDTTPIISLIKIGHLDLLQKLYKNAISHPEDPDIPRAVSIVWHKKPKNSLQNNKLALPKKNNK